MQKSICEMAKFMKEFIPNDTLEGYTLNPKIKHIASEEDIWRGVLVFKEFLFKVYDYLIDNGNLYEKPKKINNNSGHGNIVSLAVGYPFINNLTTILKNIGYYGNLVDNATAIEIDLQAMLCIKGFPEKPDAQALSFQKALEIFKLLELCGLYFHEIDFNHQKIDLKNINKLKILYLDNPILFIGLKIMAIADKELSTKNDYYIFQRCDYNILKNKLPDNTELLKSYLHLLSPDIQEFVLKLHQNHLNYGLKCNMKMHYFGVIFSYMYKSNVIWDFMPSPDGCYIYTKAKNLDKYADEIISFPLFFQKKISEGYGCDKKKFGEFCHKGCHGFSFLLNNCTIDILQEIEIWLDKEIRACK